MKKRREKIMITEFGRLLADEQQRRHLAARRRLKAQSDAAIEDYQRGLAEIHARGDGKVIAVRGDDGKPWYVEPRDAGDELEGPAPVQYLAHLESDWQANSDPQPRLPDDGIWVGLEPQKPAVPLILKPPGAVIVQLIDYLPGRSVLRKDLLQVIADMRQEHYDCLKARDERGARLAVWRGWLEIARAILPSWTMGLVSWSARWFATKFFHGS